MKNEYMRQMYLGTIGDMKNLEQHFAEMAEKGWMIDKIGLLTHRYLAVEPCKRRFFVDFLPQITAFDYPENEDAQEYRRICEESGWGFITANKQFHVFCAGGDNSAPIPIHTDNTIHAKIYLKACRKYELPWFIYALIMCWFFSPMSEGAAILLSNINLFMSVGYICFFLGYIWTYVFTIRWCIQTKKSAKDSLPMPTVNRRLAKLRNTIFLVGAIASLACIVIGVALDVIGGMSAVNLLVVIIPLLVFGVGIWIRRQIDTKRRTRAFNIGFTIVILIATEVILLGGTVFAIMNMSFPENTSTLGDRPALRLADVGAVSPSNDVLFRAKGTPLVPVDYEYREHNSEGDVETQIYRGISKPLTKWLYDYCAEDFTEGYQGWIDIHEYSQDILKTLSPDEAAFWGAESGMSFTFVDSRGVHLLLYNDNAILLLDAEGENMELDTVRQAVLKLWVE
jgi:hypothetical protein